MNPYRLWKVLFSGWVLLGPLPGMAAEAGAGPSPAPDALSTATPQAGSDSEDDLSPVQELVETPTPSGPMPEGMTLPSTLTPQATPKVKTLQVLKFKDENGIWDVAIAYQRGQATPTAVSSPTPLPVGRIFCIPKANQADFKQMAEWLEKALYSKSGLDPDTIQQKSTQGDENAQVVLGWAYLSGCWGGTDWAKAADLFEKATESGNEFGMALSGLCYLEGYGVQSDTARGELLIQDAAKSENSLGEVFEGLLDSGYSSTLSGADKEKRNVYLDWAAQWYQKAADQGDPLAQDLLGYCYFTGCGEPKDNYKAFEWFQKAADQGSGLAEHNVGCMYFYGYGPPLDATRAYQYFLASAEKGEWGDLEMVGKACISGYQMPRDEAKGLQMLEDAAAQGNDLAAFDLGEIFAKGINNINIASNKEKSDLYFGQYAAQSLPEREAYIGWIFEKGLEIPWVGEQRISFTKDYHQAVYWYQKAEKHGSPVAMLQLGKLYFRGLGGLPKDESKTKEYFAKYAQACGEAGECFLGDTYQKNWGVDQDYDLALQWYRKAAEEGYANAQFGLAGMYYHGRGVEVDKAQAAEWYLKSAEQGGDIAQNEIGYLYRHGWGVPQDYAQAMEWFKKSAAQGNVHAMDNIGWMNEHGMGIPVNDKEALKWYQMGADKGYQKCLNNLRRLQRKGNGGKDETNDGLRPNKT